MLRKRFFAQTVFRSLNFIILLFLILGILNLSLKISILQFEYSYNNKLFIEKYCENKDKPELKCNGKCHLKKVMNSGEESSENNTSILFDIVFNSSVENKSKNSFHFESSKKVIYSKNQIKDSLTIFFIDHPPKNLI